MRTKSPFQDLLGRLFFKSNIFFLSCGMIFFALFIPLGFGSLLSVLFFNSVLPIKITGVLVTIMCLIVGLLGLIQIIRREAPGLGWQFPIKGIPAIIYGLLGLIISWGAAIFMIYITIKEL